jgi:hypothetical protein
MAKVLVVGTAVQKAVLQEVLLGEIATGFWKNARPADHAESWKGVEIKVGTVLGASGFEIPRNYNLVNPDFFQKSGKRMLEAAQVIDNNITEKQLKKQLIALNQILGGRLKEIGGTVTKLPRGRKAPAESTETKSKPASTTTVKRVAANVVDPTTVETDA